MTPRTTPSRRRRTRFAAIALTAALATLSGSSAWSVPVAMAADPASTDPSLGVPEAGLSSAARAALQGRLDRLRDRYGIPGVSVAITLGDGTTWLGTSGFSDVKGEVRVEPDTAFAVASISKTFTSALVMAQVEDGLIDLDASVRTYLPDLAISRKVTVRQLLDHTSGLRDFFLDPRIDRALLKDRSATWTAGRSLRYVGKAYFKPGTGWHYSNTNYLILGLLAEHIGGRPLAEQLRTRFLDPLDLDHTFDQVSEAPAGPVARGYRFGDPAPAGKPIDLSDGSTMAPFTSVVTAAGAAGSIASTAGDLTRWVRALYGGAVLQPATVHAMVADVAITARKHATIPYGLGVQAFEVDGHPSLGHSGRLLGFRAVVRWLPQERVAIAVVTNQSRTDPATIAQSLLRLALASEVRPEERQRLMYAQLVSRGVL